MKQNDKIVIELSEKEAIALQHYLLNSVHNYGNGHVHNYVAFLAHHNNTFAVEAMKIRHKVLDSLQKNQTLLEAFHESKRQRKTIRKTNGCHGTVSVDSKLVSCATD